MAKTFDTIEAYDADRNAREVPPDGDAYNELFGIAQAQIAALTAGSEEERLAAAVASWLRSRGEPIPPDYTFGMMLQLASDIEANRTEGAAVDALPKPKYMGEVEHKIVSRLLTDLLAAGFEIRVHDGEDTALERSTDPKAIMAALASTDEDWLFLYRAAERLGWVRLIWGNGVDVISDNTDKPEINDVLKGAEALAETLEAA